MQILIFNTEIEIIEHILLLEYVCLYYISYKRSSSSPLIKEGEEGGRGKKKKLDAIDQGLTKEIDIQIPINK